MSTSTNETLVLNGTVKTRPLPPPPSTGSGSTATSIPATKAAPPPKSNSPQSPTTPSPQPTTQLPPLTSSGSDSVTQPSMALSTKIPWGKFKGKSLAELALTEEGCSYLFFLAFKSEIKNASDQPLKQAAAQWVLEVVSQRVQAAITQPDAAMPVLPFGDDKGKALHQAHPKWVAILAKKLDADARSFNDLVLYAVARHLQAERGLTSGFKRGGPTPEQIDQFLSEFKAIRIALEGLLRQKA